VAAQAEFHLDPAGHYLLADKAVSYGSRPIGKKRVGTSRQREALRRLPSVYDSRFPGLKGTSGNEWEWKEPVADLPLPDEGLRIARSLA
jgi:hypothetical protein